MNEDRVRTFRVFGWKLRVVYRQSPFVHAWGYRPLFIGLGFFGALFAMRVTL